MNQSVRVENTVELINITPVNPLISKCQIKVCYVSDDPNRNQSIISKEVASKELANSLPGSPIVGYYNEENKDFEGHNSSIDVVDGKLILKEETRPYGFVDLNANVWFEKFLDNGVEHEYLMTEGWLWTGQYPEAKRILEKGNNQSMELDKKFTNGNWTKDCNGNQQFFIINEAIISKLCILGDDVEPCFEGANITAPEINFSLEEDFKNKMFSLMEEMKNILEGGVVNMENSEMIQEVEEVSTPAEEVVEFSEVEETTEENVEVVAAADETDLSTEPAVEEEPTTTYDLNEVVEYQDLLVQYNDLEIKYNNLVSNNEAINAELNSLREFKAKIDKQEKERMINSFYMLSDEDKKDVIDNIDTYSIDEIEAKLSIICVRNKVSFSLEEENNVSEKEPIVYNFMDCEDSSTPAWVKSLRSVAEELK